MKLSGLKAIKTGQWFVNEILLESDVNFIGESTYQNLTDQMAILSESELNNGKDVIIGGFDIIHDTLLTVDLKSGGGVSSQGAYINTDVWGFVADAGSVFGVIIPVDQSITFDGGGSNNRIDLVEIRPIEVPYNGLNRKFKDPITGLLSTANVKTRKEYGFEFAVKKGTEATTPVADVKTVGWIKIAEVYVATGASSIVQSNIKDVRGSWSWTTEADDTLSMLYILGLELSKFTTTERNNLQYPRIGTLIYNTTQDRMNVRADNSGSHRWEYPDGVDATT